jgi:hypothetical protein
MKTIIGRFKNRAFILVVFLILSLFPCCAWAVVLPPQPDEVQNLQIETSVLGTGGFHQTSAIEWALSSELLNVNMVERGEDWPELVLEPEPPLHPFGEVQSYVTYSEDTQANMGTISFDKITGLDTEVKTGAQYNVQNDRMITFTGIDAGSLLSSEDMTMYNLGNCTRAPSICPFSGGVEEATPSFCSRIEFGSDLDVSKVAVVTSAGVRNVNRPLPTAEDIIIWPPEPNGDEPALAHYMIQVTEIGQGKPSVGLVATYLKIQTIDGRTECAGYPYPYQELKVDESQSMKGDINLFEYLMDYKDGIGISA